MSLNLDYDGNFFQQGEGVAPMVKTKNVEKRESLIRSILGSVLIVLSFFISGIFWLGVGLIGAIIVVSAIFKYRPCKGFLLNVFSKEGKEK